MQQYLHYKEIGDLVDHLGLHYNLISSLCKMHQHLHYRDLKDLVGHYDLHNSFLNHQCLCDIHNSNHPYFSALSSNRLLTNLVGRAHWSARWRCAHDLRVISRLANSRTCFRKRRLTIAGEGTSSWINQDNITYKRLYNLEVPGKSLQ